MEDEVAFNHDDIYSGQNEEFFDDEATIREKTIDPSYDEAEV